MSMTFTKLFSSITESTIWVEDNETRIVWITMLAMADRFGRVWGSVPGLANRARVSVEDAEKALAKFKAPDTYSRTKTNEGRRIEDIDGGWRLLNYEKHRAIRDEEAIRESKRAYINRRRAAERTDKAVENVERCRANAEAEAEEEKKTEQIGAAPSAGDKRPPPKLSDDQWQAEVATAYPRLSVPAEIAKAKAWALTNRRQPTRRFLVNWLNRADERLTPFNSSSQAAPKADPYLRASAAWGALTPEARSEWQRLVLALAGGSQDAEKRQDALDEARSTVRMSYRGDYTAHLALLRRLAKERGVTADR